MSPAALFSRFILLLSLAIFPCAPSVNAQQSQSSLPATPLVSKVFAYPTGIPYQADTDTQLVRGPQSGYNLCNSTTEGPDSECQTLLINDASDFCLWAPATPNSLIADTEGEEVAWCTKPGHGTRVIPPGALQGVQFMRTDAYIQVVGFIDQTLINMQAGDSGGELDPHGADLRGNPLGGLVYSNAWGNSNDSYSQVVEWHNFMGGNQFCLKACLPSSSSSNSSGTSIYCNHVYDRIGCEYNAPNNAQNGSFTSCLGDVQDPPGIYTVNGTVSTYTQPPRSLGAISTLPYEARVPASSRCTTWESAELFPTPSASNSGRDVVPTDAPAGFNSATLRFATGVSGASAMPSATGVPSGAIANKQGPGADGVWVLGAVLGVVGFVSWI